MELQYMENTVVPTEYDIFTQKKNVNNKIDFQLGWSLCLYLSFQDSFDLDMDFSKTKKKKKTKKKDLDEFIAEDEKKKAEDKENGIRF